MKKSNLFQDALEREIQDLLAPYPDPMGRTDFRKACRIATRTSLYLLQSGLVPVRTPASRPAAIRSPNPTWPPTCAAASPSRPTTPRPAAGTRTTRTTSPRPLA